MLGSISIEQVREFLGWACVMNFSMLFLSTFMWLFAKDFLFKIHEKFFPLSREQMNLSMYNLLGIYKLLIIVFNFVPYVALVIMGA